MGILSSGQGLSPRPVVKNHYQSSIPELYIIGDLAGAPVIKLAMEHGYEVINHIASLPDAKGEDEAVYDVLICGSGAAGLNAALQAHEHGMSCLVLEKGKIANTIENFPEGKWIYAEPDQVPPKGKLWLDGAAKEDLLSRWHSIVDDNKLNVKTGEEVQNITRENGTFSVTTDKENYQARRVILAMGQRGNPRTLGVPGEDREEVYHQLYSPRLYENQNIIVIGGGNSAIEAALTLAEENNVLLSYRKDSFYRIFKDNEKKLFVAIAEGSIEIVFESNIVEFKDKEAVLQVKNETRTVPYNHAFVLVGAEMPVKFFKKIGAKLEGEWDIGRWSFFAIWLLLVYSIYGIKFHLWPFNLKPQSFYYLLGRSPSFWYTVLYSVVMVGFGIPAIRRWGIKPKDKYQINRYISLIGFQLIFFFVIPEFIMFAIDKAHWWRSYGFFYAWPLFFPTFFYGPPLGYVIWGILLTLVVIPIFVYYHGKRYCTWICGCGGLAETLGDRWRHFAPKGEASLKWEKMGDIIFGLVLLATLLFLIKDTASFLSGTGQFAHDIYKIVVDLWLVGIIPVGLYPFLGGKVWCRYWCPLAKIMEHLSRWYSKFLISSDHKCIACGECTRYCQVGINVMKYALKQEEFSNKNSSCIGCGICVTVCPMDCLKFGAQPKESPPEH